MSPKDQVFTFDNSNYGKKVLSKDSGCSTKEPIPEDKAASSLVICFSLLFLCCNILLAQKL